MSLRSIIETLRRIHPPLLAEDKGVVKRIPYASLAEQPEVKLDDLVEIYEKDEDAKLAVDSWAFSAVGQGFYTTSRDPRAKEVIDEFCENANMDAFLLSAAKEIVAFGNSFTELVEADDLVQLKVLPVSSTWKIDRTPTGALQKITQERAGRRVEFEPNEILHWKWNAIDGNAFGRGLLQTLAETTKYSLKFSDSSTKTHTLPSLYMIKAMMRDDLRKLLHHNVPKAAWVFKDASDDYVVSQASVIAKLDAGERIATNKELQIVEEVLDPRGRYDFLVKHFDDAYTRALQTPVTKLYTEHGYTEASARVVQEMYRPQVNALQKYLKREVENKIFLLVLRQSGFDPKEAHVRLLWGMEERPEVVVADILHAVELGVVNVQEARKIFQRIGWEIQVQGDRP